MTRAEIIAAVEANIRLVIPEFEEREIRLDDSLVDLGANSVDRAEILTLTLESLGLQVPRVALFGAYDLGELVDLLYERATA